MSAYDFTLEELNQKITALFEIYKEELNNREHPNVNSLLFQVNSVFDILLYKVKYELSQFMANKVKEETVAGTKSDDIKSQKAECLIKLQMLTSQLTCHIVEDYKKKMEEKRKRNCP